MLRRAARARQGIRARRWRSSTAGRRSRDLRALGHLAHIDQVADIAKPFADPQADVGRTGQQPRLVALLYSAARLSSVRKWKVAARRVSGRLAL